MFDYSSREKTKFNHRKTGIGMLSRSSEKIKNGQRNNFLQTKNTGEITEV